MNWAVIFNRLLELIDQDDTPNYFSGPRFLRKAREIDRYFPTYQQFIDQRRAEGKSTTRRDYYYYDILLGFPEPARVAFVNSILDELDETAAVKMAELRAIFGGAVPGPVAVVPDHGWNADRLNQYLAKIDHCITTSQYERAVTLAYTCLKGFYKAFVAHCIPECADETEIIALAKCIKRYLSQTIGSYPYEALSMVNHISHTVDRARNRFSEAHFDEEAARWLAVYVRDLVNTQIRLLLHFL
jgi:hypothetical protein